MTFELSCDGSVLCDAGRGIKSIQQAESRGWRFIRALTSADGPSKTKFTGTCPQCDGDKTCYDHKKRKV
jgi:hypothetical protein